ncbi:hypothetical protein ACEE18_10580 [Corynebacterium freneyi]
MTDNKQEQGGTWGGIVALVLIGAVLAGGWFFFFKKDPVAVGSCIGEDAVAEADGSGGEVPGAVEVLALDPDPKTFDEPALPGVPGTCEKLGAPEATQYYKWGLPVTGFSSATNYDKGMCLAEVS